MGGTRRGAKTLEILTNKDLREKGRKGVKRRERQLEYKGGQSLCV